MGLISHVDLTRGIVPDAAFGFGWTPCIGPVLGGILVLGATSESFGRAYCFGEFMSSGLGVPFLLSAYFMTPFMRRLSLLRRTGRYLQIMTGAILVLMGIAVATGQLMQFAI